MRVVRVDVLSEMDSRRHIDLQAPRCAPLSECLVVDDSGGRVIEQVET